MVEAVATLQFLLEGTALPGKLGPVQGTQDRQVGLVFQQGLGEVIEGSRPDRLDRILHRAETGGQDHHEVGIAGREAVQEIETSPGGEVGIHQGKVHPAGTDDLQGLVGFSHQVHLHLFRLEVVHQGFDRPRVGVDDQDMRAHSIQAVLVLPWHGPQRWPMFPIGTGAQGAEPRFGTKPSGAESAPGAGDPRHPNGPGLGPPGTGPRRRRRPGRVPAPAS